MRRSVRAQAPRRAPLTFGHSDRATQKARGASRASRASATSSSSHRVELKARQRRRAASQSFGRHGGAACRGRVLTAASYGLEHVNDDGRVQRCEEPVTHCRVHKQRAKGSIIRDAVRLMLVAKEMEGRSLAPHDVGKQRHTCSSVQRTGRWPVRDE
eukprot:CAMPEP_0119425292 /NCGR_PEP_ID=MMETSP1335-20130426/34241_1 /TAXON_ID=259385 /ORGANISM="Chrysoculter rhomboideus, Strain RCC1486" /LENGTH=156 /DNA_ID=CAMNT_0007450851 /DNA_START=181 /DNA_END=649 /DNA_ORIENTATION=+